MPRFASALVVIGLLAGTVAAFAITERLKLVRSPIFDTTLDRRLFSPVCGCESNGVTIGFRLREPDRLTVTVVDSGGRTVRTLIRDELRPAGPVSVRWDGRDGAGRVLPEGSYRPRVHVDRLDAELPNPMRIDTTPPEVLAATARPETFSPDGDGRRDKTRVSYELSEDGRVLLAVDGAVLVRGLRTRVQGSLDFHGAGFPPGAYELEVSAVDRAGNVSASSVPVEVTIRFIELSRRVIRVPAGAQFSVGVDTDAASYDWRLRFAAGRASSPELVLRAPREPGRYALVVEANGRKARARVIVRAR